MKTISAQELKQWMDEKKDFQLIDCRETFEFEELNIGGELIPMNTIPANLDKIRTDVDVVIHCRSGVRSGNVIQWLNENHGFTNLLNLDGGVIAFSSI
jgi:sulfur-carrier protein adenylyltransferase/sulfurtransferase